MCRRIGMDDCVVGSLSLQYKIFVQRRRQLDLAWILVTGWSSGLGESRTQRSEQGFLCDGLVQTRHGSTAQRFRGNLQTSFRCDENDRRLDIFSRQTSLQLEATDHRHTHVQDETSGTAQVWGVQKLLSRDESCGGVADRLQQTDDGLNNGSIVVHNRNQRNICSNCRRQKCVSLKLATVNASTVRKMASINTLVTAAVIF